MSSKTDCSCLCLKFTHQASYLDMQSGVGNATLRCHAHNNSIGISLHERVFPRHHRSGRKSGFRNLGTGLETREPSGLDIISEVDVFHTYKLQILCIFL